MLATDTDSTPQPKPVDALLTRLEAAEFIRHDLGRPLSFSTLTKLCALGEGPPIASRWGRRPLYTRDDLRAWAEARSRTAREEHSPTKSGLLKTSNQS